MAYNIICTSWNVSSVISILNLSVIFVSYCMSNWFFYILFYLLDEKNEDRRRIFAEKSNEYLMRAEQLKEHLDKLEDKSETSEPSANGSTKEKYEEFFV